MDKRGYLDFAAGGTLFLDEIGELSLNMQVKLLRSIEAGGYTPVGSAVGKKSDFRIIAATHRNLLDQVKKGEMREDFFYRIHIIPIYLPPLIKRKEDIPFLVDHFLQSHGDSKRLSTIPGKVMEALYNYDWPGNVRELQNALLRYLAVGRLDFIHGGEPVKQAMERDSPEGPALGEQDFKSAVEVFERNLITQALNRTKWNRTKAAAMLGIPRKTLFRKMKKYGTI
jgi:transcriptional regulator with PAS, ATPase and Fis domain